jgi:hypothetical protein
VRFDELVMTVASEELRVKFHPQLTLLAGLSAAERQSLSSSILGALGGGPESTTLRYLDGTGRVVNVRGEAGTVTAQYEDDGSPAPLPLGSLAPDRAALRELMLLEANDLGIAPRPPRPDEPPELVEARATLADLSETLHEALGDERQTAGLEAELASLERQLRTAKDTMAQREYAEVLARLERVRAEVAALETGSVGIDADRKLVSTAGTVHELAARWSEAARVVRSHLEAFGAVERLPELERATAAAVPDELPGDLAVAVDVLVRAQDERDTLDHRLQMLAVAKLPAPSDPIVGELGLLDQTTLWPAARRLSDATDEMDRIRVSLGGLGGDDGPEPAVIEAIETTHRIVENAENDAENLRIPGVASTGLGLSLALMGAIGAPILMPIGMLGAAITGTVLLVQPKRRIAEAAAVEREALAAVGATSYLGFHIRRVDATVDPSVRDSVESALHEHRDAHEAWMELVGSDIDVRHALRLDAEVQAYHDALKNLGGAADEIEHLRRELADRAEPALADARRAVVELCEPYGLSPDAMTDGAAISAEVMTRIEAGRAARRQAELQTAEAEEQRAAALLDDLLGQLGFADGDRDARVGAHEWAVARAAEREEARARSRPRAEIDAELGELEAIAQKLKRPEWGAVTAADADAPDIPELERRREKVQAKLDEVRPEVDVERLADRHSAAERRVASLAAKHSGHDVLSDPAAVADIQHHLLARLTAAAQAGPLGDPVPVVLDEVLQRVPPDRTWDLLDLLYRLSERHQLLYLSDDPFVAAWARQHAGTGTVMLLEPEPESESV